MNPSMVADSRAMKHHKGKVRILKWTAAEEDWMEENEMTAGKLVAKWNKKKSKSFVPFAKWMNADRGTDTAVRVRASEICFCLPLLESGKWILQWWQIRAPWNTTKGKVRILKWTAAEEDWMEENEMTAGKLVAKWNKKKSKSFVPFAKWMNADRGTDTAVRVRA